ncbi:MAG: hypothetical protein WBB65_12065 [Anaerolineales bacterium]
MKDLINRRLFLPAIVVMAILSTGAFLIICAQKTSLGFPLDDAWIHQTYARNLGEMGEWSFIPGQSSAGSTSPLWSALIAIGYYFEIPYKWWTYGVGMIALVATAWLAVDWFEIKDRPPGLWPIGLAALLLLEWHLVWAALSGMETILLAFLSVLFFWVLARDTLNFFGVGVLIGVGIWIRPDALILLLPAAWTILIMHNGKPLQIGSALLQVIAGISGLFLIYLYMNWTVAGSVWPSTFYAKQVEYTALRQSPFIYRYLGQVRAIAAGALFIVLPGILLSVIQAITSRSWQRLAPIIWAGAYLGAYALRLPATYQHGRYAIPTIPILLAVGCEGIWIWYSQNGGARIKRFIHHVWVLSLAAVGVLFWWQGSQAYAQDVAIIETEMVKASRWVAEKTESGSSIAAHDIGALGYFGNRIIIDLAGLVTPEVIPIIRSEDDLESFLDQNSADYLMTFPGWYPRLVNGRELIYSTNSEFSLQSGGENMAIYHWR